ncbi:APC family permease [Bacillus sp. AFS029533]|uniref:APC family permease n=1 Tax=Bacillus sp. AFS029533 TaxID=2033494 RepID=UPI000BFDF547|nr:APC family permease [Bacillus sp. AFS029533]PGZ92276.1 hypothetical protein COE53_13010 [Bacillus sp. AFS029533]
MKKELRRMLSLSSIVSIGAGLVFCALEYNVAAGVAGYVSGDSAWIPILITGIIMLVAWASFSELNSLYPTAAAIRLFMVKSMSDRVSVTITFTYMLAVVLIIAADAFIVGKTLDFVFGGGFMLSIVFIVLILGIATYTNLKGLKMAASLQDVGTYIVLVVTLIVVIIGFARNGFELNQPFNPLEKHGTVGLLQAIALAIFGYAGFEWVTTNAEEVRKPSYIPNGMLLTIIVCFIVFTAITVGMGHFLSPAQLETPYPQIYFAEKCLGVVGIYIMVAVTSITAINTFNGGFLTGSRFMYAIAREGVLPPSFSKLNNQAVPYVAVWTLSILSLVISVYVGITGKWQVIVALGAVLEAMIYAVSCYCVIRLRRKQPNQTRSFKMFAARLLAPFGIILFSTLALIASVTVGVEINLLPLIILLVVITLSAIYTIYILPKLREKEAARKASRPKRRPVREKTEGNINT